MPAPWRAAIGAMADSLDDNHVAYLEPKVWRNTVSAELGLEYIPTAGFEVALDEATGKYYLYTVFPDSPAERAGLRAGDLIDSVGGAPIGREQQNRPLGDLMNGLPGTGNTVQVTRPATGQTETVIITVAEVDVPLIEVAILPGKVGYLRLRYFSFSSGEAFDRALAALQARDHLADLRRSAESGRLVRRAAAHPQPLHTRGTAGDHDR